MQYEFRRNRAVFRRSWTQVDWCSYSFILHSLALYSTVCGVEFYSGTLATNYRSFSLFQYTSPHNLLNQNCDLKTTKKNKCIVGNWKICFIWEVYIFTSLIFVLNCTNKSSLFLRNCNSVWIWLVLWTWFWLPF